MLHREKSTREATNAVLCVKVQPHDVDSDKADSDVTFVDLFLVCFCFVFLMEVSQKSRTSDDYTNMTQSKKRKCIFPLI